MQKIGIENLFSWSEFKLEYPSSCLEYQTLDEDDDFFLKTFDDEEILLIEHKTNFGSAKYFCKAFGGKLITPQNDYEIEKVSSHIRNSKMCTRAYIGATKDDDGKLVDLNGNDVSFARWYVGEPNGKTYEKCIAVVSSPNYTDINCLEQNCFACQMPTKNIFSLRGNIPTNMERHYYVSFTGKKIEIRGLKGTQCSWSNNTWNFGSGLKQDNNSGYNIPPVGLHHWNDGKKLKFTQCNENEFTCRNYGYCISMDQNCDGHLDCLDGSDEMDCELMVLQQGYNRLEMLKNKNQLIDAVYNNLKHL